MFFDTWTLETTKALTNLWVGFLNFLPNLVGALIVFIIGWIVSVVVGKIVAEVLNRLKINQIFEKAGWKEALEKAELKVKATDFIGAIVKWILVIVFLSASVEILGLKEFADAMNSVIGYLPNVVVAVLIFVITVIIVDIVEKVIRSAVEGVRVGYGRAVSSIVKWAVWTFAILAILKQLLVVPDLINIVFGALIYGVVALFVISFGIAFGLGGKDVAAEILRDVKERIKK